MSFQLSKIRQTSIFILMLMFFSACLKDKTTHTYKIYLPVYKSLTEVRAGIKSSQPQAVKNPGKIYLLGSYIFLAEKGKGIHVIDNANPAAPVNHSFINLPGNIDMAVKDNILYANSYSDLVAINISDPANVNATKILNNVFPQQNTYWYSGQSNPDSIKVLVDYIEKDTTVSYDLYRSDSLMRDRCANCMYASAANAAPGKGIGGSMACFAVSGDYMYTVSSSELRVFNMSSAANPQYVKAVTLNNFGVETIFPFKDKIFIGTTTGMLIYGVTDPLNPAKLSQFSHFRSCDPVIADDDYAYVTLRSGTNCGTSINQLHVVDIRNLTYPVTKKTYEMQNPHGLSKDGSKLIVCEGKAGVKLYDASDVSNLKLQSHISDLKAFDVIMHNNVALVTAEDGLYQYSYTGQKELRLLSRMGINKR